jgi:hypothetical protein
VLETENSDIGILKPVRNKDEAFMVAYAAEWSGAKISKKSRLELLREAASGGSKEKSTWARKVLSQMENQKKQAKPEGAWLVRPRTTS